MSVLTTPVNDYAPIGDPDEPLPLALTPAARHIVRAYAPVLDYEATECYAEALYHRRFNGEPLTAADLHFLSIRLAARCWQMENGQLDLLHADI
jgi:hypothetical protein